MEAAPAKTPTVFDTTPYQHGYDAARAKRRKISECPYDQTTEPCCRRAWRMGFADGWFDRTGRILDGSHRWHELCSV